MKNIGNRMLCTDLQIPQVLIDSSRKTTNSMKFVEQKQNRTESNKIISGLSHKLVIKKNKKTQTVEIMNKTLKQSQAVGYSTLRST